MAKQNEDALSAEELAAIERKFDPETAFRPTATFVTLALSVPLAGLAFYQYYASGFALIRELLHRGIFLAFMLGLVFLLFAARRSSRTAPPPPAWWHVGGIPLWDIALALLGVAAALYLPLLPPEIVARRIGDPALSDIFMGTALLVLVLEAARRSIGWTLPLISLIFIGFAYFGPYMPGALLHGGASWGGIINHLYMTNQGIYGIAIGVMAKYVFLFILFGVLATRIGLGQLFIDLAMALAGRYSGGPAKVAIFSSAFMGTISGSSIANTVTTGSLTIPAMKRIGYPPHFSGAVEATASTGGQITPPILGAAAFIMVEYLEIPLRDVLAAALFPALLHYFGVFIMVHLEARKLGLRGLRREELPQVLQVLAKHWMTLIPLIILVYMILAGWTPDYAAVWGIGACVVVGFVNPHNRMTLRELWDALADGSRNTLAVGAAAATVGIVVGVVTLTGVGFRLGFVVVQTANDFAGFFSNIWPISYFGIEALALFFSLILIAIACVLMGAGVPTTATYIILVAVAAPALAQLGVEPIVSHFFVFYYGVLADITPPVALAAYAAAGIAGSNPFKTGNTAFRLGIAKALVPFVFVYSPALLLVAGGFSWAEFAVTLLGAMLGIGFLGAAFSGFMFAHMARVERWYVGCVSLIFIAPGVTTLLIGLVAMAPVIFFQMRKRNALLSEGVT
ncbi:MAG: TRAP transporter permease [Pseudomonadota bacterium]